MSINAEAHIPALANRSYRIPNLLTIGRDSAEGEAQIVGAKRYLISR